MSVVRLKRKNGVIIQDCDIYIGRRMTMGGWNLPQSKWANPFKIKDFGTIEECLNEYEKYVRNNPNLIKSLHELQNKILGCWCKPNPCHGDILLKLLNEYYNNNQNNMFNLPVETNFVDDKFNLPL